ncbi:MAG: hypothetical protein GXO07_00520 [Crenarchaeota archaeon]|nr:hypothetical protein [Thermoproteota archaeon]
MRNPAREIWKFDEALERLEKKGKTIVVTDHLDIPHHGEASALIEDLEVFEKLADKSDVVAATVAYEERANILVIYGLIRLDWLYVLYDRHVHVSASGFRLSGAPQLKEEVRRAVKQFYQKWLEKMRA